MFAAVFPWPPRAERKARVADARRQAAESREKAGESRTLTAELRWLRRKNHVSEALDQMVARKAREDQ